MFKKHLKICPTSLVMREMQIKMIQKIYHTPFRMAKITHVTADTGEDMEKEKHSSIVCGIASWYNDSGNQSVGSSEN